MWLILNFVAYIYFLSYSTLFQAVSHNAVTEISIILAMCANASSTGQCILCGDA